MSVVEIETKRLLLRQWKEEDLPVFAAINADSEVMKYYPSVLSAQESNALIAQFSSKIEERSWGFWAVELLNSKQFIGFIGLNEPGYTLPFSPCVEIGWRLARAYWGKGYATEGAQVSLNYAFSELGLEQVYSFTSVLNKRSLAVMQRLGMINVDTNFIHPLIAETDPLCEHVLYKITRSQWKDMKGIGEAKL